MASRKKIIGQNLTILAQQRGSNSNKLAVELNVPPSRVYRAMSGVNEAEADLICRIALHWGVSTDRILLTDEERLHTRRPMHVHTQGGKHAGSLAKT